MAGPIKWPYSILSVVAQPVSARKAVFSNQFIVTTDRELSMGVIRKIISLAPENTSITFWTDRPEDIKYCTVDVLERNPDRFTVRYSK